MPVRRMGQAQTCAALGSQRNGWRGVNKLQTTDPIAAAIRTANAHVWNASLLLPWYIVRSRRTRNAPKRPRHPQCRGLLLSLAGQGCFFVHQLSYPKTSSPGHWPGLSIPDWMRECYIFGLHVLALASHTPPALVHSAWVFAVVTSAAKAGAVKATASPSETIAAITLFMTTPPCA